LKIRHKLYIGIDPAFRANGFAICIIDTSDKSARFVTFKDGFLGFVSWFLNDSPSEAIICIENSNLQKSTFDMRGNKKEVARKSRNVGINQAVSQCTVDLCKTKYKVIDCSPKQKGGKWNKATFNIVLSQKKHTTIKKTSNQDERDAYKLALIALEKPFLAR
jgi:hypothetical protein